MPLTLWTEHGHGHRGPAFFQRISKSLTKPDQSTHYIVPSQSMKRRAESLCLTNGILFGPSILTHMEWCTLLAQDTLPIISRNGQRQVVTQLAHSIPMTYFHTSSLSPGVVDMLIQGITSALLGGLQAPLVKALAKEYGFEREHDLALIFDAYLKALGSKSLRDRAQVPQLAIENIGKRPQIAKTRYIVDFGTQPIPVLWKVVLALHHHALCDLHVIIPEYLRSTAESRLGTTAIKISSDEWISCLPAKPKLMLAPNPNAGNKWAAQYLFQTQSGQNPQAQIALINNNSNQALWWETCQEVGLLQNSPLPLPIAASPTSAPWYDHCIWESAPQSASIYDWHHWWQQHLYPSSLVDLLSSKLSTDDYAARSLDTVSKWEKIWTQCMALYGETKKISQNELQNIIEPMLHNNIGIDENQLAYAPSTLHDFLGDPIESAIIMDATQPLFPSIRASAFFKRASLFAEDPNITQLKDAFPSPDVLLSQSQAAWDRLLGIAHEVVAVYSVVSDTGSDQLPSLLFDTEGQAIDFAVQRLSTSQHTIKQPPTLLQSMDTVSHVQSRYLHHKFSVTELEAFAKCRFSHFAKYILNIVIPDIDTPELLAKDEGRLIHRLLEQYYQELHSTTEIRPTLEELLRRLVPKPTPLQRIQLDQLLETASAAIHLDKSEFARLGKNTLAPTYFEWTFGSNEHPITIRDRLGQSISIRGKIDRIDSNSATGRMLIMDYKFKKSDSVIADIQQGRHLQLPIYVLAAQSAFPDFTILGALLFDLKTPRRQHGIAHRSESEFLGISPRIKSLLKENDWEDILQIAADYGVQYAQTIASGVIPIADHQCEYCDWNGLIPWETDSSSNHL